MNRQLLRFSIFSAVIVLLINLAPVSELPTFAAAGDWKPDGSVFPHGTGISRGTAAQIQPDSSVGPSVTARTINPADISGGHVYDCSVGNPNNHLADIANDHYFPDGIGYSSFNNYRNEFESAQPGPDPNTFFESAINDEVERNYLGGKEVASGPPTGATKDLTILDPADLGAGADMFMLAFVHNNASTALNPTDPSETSDPRSTLTNSGGTKNLSARAENTRMHFSVPSLALPVGQDSTFVNRLRADNAYHIDNGGTCNDLIQQQVSDIAKVRNSTAGPITFQVLNAFYQNPYVTAVNANWPDIGGGTVNFPPAQRARLVDPALNQANIADPRNPSQLSAAQGARLSSGRASTPSRRNEPNQIDNAECVGNQANGDCNAYAPPVLSSGEYDGRWYGSVEFARYVGIDVDAVAATPRISVSKLVRRVLPAPETFNYAGSPYAPTSTTISGNGNGEVEFEILVQNTGNVDLDDVNFADVLPTDLTAVGLDTGLDTITGTVEICTNLAAAQTYSTPSCAPSLINIPLTTDDTTIRLSATDMGIAAATPLRRDPTFITGSTSVDGEVIRIRWRMSSICTPEGNTPPTATNYGLVSASSSDVPAGVVTLDALTQFAGPYNITAGQWTSLFPVGAPLGANQATNQVSVSLNRCAIGQPGITIGKFVRRITPATAETFFPNPHVTGDTIGGRTSTTITGTTGGEVQYEILIQNTGSGSISSVNFGDRLPAELTLVANSITTERCEDLAEATAVPDQACTADTINAVSDSVLDVPSRIMYIDTTEMGFTGVNISTPLLSGEVIRIRWNMSALCNPQTPTAVNYGMVMAGTGGTALPGAANVQVFPGYTAHTGTLVPSEADMRNQFDQPNALPGPTNDTFVTISPCSPPPPPGPKKFASTVAHPAGTTFPVPATFQDAQTTATAVDFGVRTAPYTAFFRITLTNTGSTALSNVVMDDEFHLRNGVTVTPQSVIETVGSRLDSFDVTAGTETALSPDAVKVLYLGASPTTPNGLRFQVPRILPGQTIAYYYSITVDPTVAVPARPSGIEYHRNIVRVCLPIPGSSTSVCTDAGSDDAFISDRTPPPTNQVITIIKTVNGQDADTDATAVSVTNGGGLSYAITVTAPATNTATVTGIRLTDTVTTLPNVTGITNIRLVTPAGACIAPAGCAIANIQTDLPTRTFDLAPGQSAVLTYQATATNTGTSTSAFNRNTATATPNNAPPVSNPATVVVPGNRTPDTDFKIDKKVNPQVVRNGDEVEYTITVEPDGDNDDIADLVLLITDDINDDGTLSQGGVTLTYVRNSTDIETDDADCEGEMDDEDGIRCEDVSPDDEITITYKARVSVRNLICPETVTVDNTATLRDDTPNVDIRDDDDAEVRTICTPPPSDRPLTIEKNVDRREVRRGEIANYTIIVRNPNETTATTRLVDTIGLNNGTVPGQNGGRVRFIPGSLQVSGAGFTGSIANPEGVVLTIPGNGQATIQYQASGEPEANQSMISLAPNTATLDTGAYATAFVELPKTGPEAAGMVAGLISAIGAYIATRKRK